MMHAPAHTYTQKHTDTRARATATLVNNWQGDTPSSLNRSWQSIKGTFHASGIAEIEPMPYESEDWAPLWP